MRKIRWGIAGPGNIANKFAEAIKNIDGAELVAVASRSYEKASAFAEKHGVQNIFSSYEQLAMYDDVDAVYVSTIHPFHKPCAELFIKNKKHVLCEKPICVNSYQAKMLSQCAKENGVFLMEAMWTRFLPAIKETKAMIERGEIGEVKGFEADFCYRETPETASIVFDNSIAGGALLDVGIYPLNLSAYLFGKNRKITAVSVNSEGVDLHTQMTVSYENGIIASLSCAIDLQKPETAFIYGTEGFIELPCFYGAQEIIITKGGEKTVIQLPSIGDGFEEEIIEACNCINDKKTESSIMPLSESIFILEEMDNIRKQIGITYPLEGEN